MKPLSNVLTEFSVKTLPKVYTVFSAKPLPNVYTEFSAKPLPNVYTEFYMKNYQISKSCYRSHFAYKKALMTYIPLSIITPLRDVNVCTWM